MVLVVRMRIRIYLSYRRGGVWLVEDLFSSTQCSFSNVEVLDVWKEDDVYVGVYH